ncbi:MAG TPA: tRNA pseudouridine(38-40) synthase TruA [Firmicutes bacterium]|nr:tRNA pseudouridine(38-40) synthase TruA [Bacillota bacterium]
MRRIRCIVTYDGTQFSGYQRQINQRTVQGELEKCLKIVTKQEVTIHGSGRTDAGVHALGQVFHFDSPLNMPSGAYRKALNGLLPDDISIVESVEVDGGFHSRLCAELKEYHYKLSMNNYDPIKRNYVYQYGRRLDLEKMEKAMRYLIGTHDFSSFCANMEDRDKVRTIFEAEIINDNGELTFRFVGSGFLRYMIRILVGTLLEVGEGKKQPEQIPVIIEAKNRRLAGRTASPEGLYLVRVQYNEKWLPLTEN